VPASTPYFHDDKTKAQIDELARKPAVVLVLGAGVGVDSGLPAWDQLIKDLLEDHGRSVLGAAAEPGDAQKFATELVTRIGPLAAGTVAQSVAQSAEAFARSLHAALYRSYQDAAQLRVGPLARRAASLALASGVTRAITTNYDDTFERALRAQLAVAEVDLPVVSVVGPETAVPAKSFAVYHVHGFLPFETTFDEGTTGRIIVGERDFVIADTWEQWRRDIYSQCFADVCVFVGTSVNDTDVLRYLYETREGTKHYVFLVRQESPFSRVSDVSQAVDVAVERALENRFAHLGLNPIIPDYFAQVGQFLNEVWLWRDALDSEDGGGQRSLSYAEWEHRYGERLIAWRREFEPLAIPAKGEPFRVNQAKIHERVRDAWSQLADECNFGRNPAELFGVHVWSRDPRPAAEGQRRLELLAASTGSVAHPRAILRVPIEDGSIWHAVATFCGGSRNVRHTDDPSSRWRYTLCAPIYLYDEPWLGLQVGVVTLSSSKPENESLLGSQPQLRSKVWEALEKVGSAVLDPERLAEIVA
jgi:hypothetical protein